MLRFSCHSDNRWPFHDHLLSSEPVSSSTSFPTVSIQIPKPKDINPVSSIPYISRHNFSPFQAHHTPTLEDSLLAGTSPDVETETRSGRIPHGELLGWVTPPGLSLPGYLPTQETAQRNGSKPRDSCNSRSLNMTVPFSRFRD